MNRTTKLVGAAIVLCAMGAFAKSKSEKVAALKSSTAKSDKAKSRNGSGALTQNDSRLTENSHRRKRQTKYHLTDRNLAQELAAPSGAGVSAGPTSPSEFTKQVNACIGGSDGVKRIVDRIRTEVETAQGRLARLQKQNKSIQKKLDSSIEAILNGAFENAPPDNRCFLANLYLQTMTGSVPGLERLTRAKLIRNQLRDARNQQLKVVDRQLFALQSKSNLSEISTRRARDQRDDQQFFARGDISTTTKILSLRKISSVTHKK